MTRLMIALVMIGFFAPISAAQELSAKDQKTLNRVLAYHKTNLECDGRGSKMEASEFIRFKAQNGYELESVVVLVSCSFHAYQVSWVAYAIYDDSEEGEITLLSFPTTPDGKKWTAGKFLMTPDWDRETKTLNTFYKGRGIGDCGDFASYRWDGGSFYLVSANNQPCCWNNAKVPACKEIRDDDPGGVDNWPLVYKYSAEKSD